MTEWSTGSRTERIIGFLDVYPGGATYCHGYKLHVLGPIVNVRLHCAWGRRRTLLRTFSFLTKYKLYRTVIDGKIVVSSAHDGTSQPVYTHCWFTWCFPGDVLRGWYPPRNTTYAWPGQFGDPPRTSPTKEKKSWVPLVISNITGGVDIHVHW